MSLKGPTPEDERKLHAEINQIGNQRFLLTTLSLTLFGVLTAWMVPKESVHDTDIGAFPFAISIILSILLFAIYFWSHLLKNTMRVFTKNPDGKRTGVNTGNNDILRIRCRRHSSF
jgi:hypothetical protein